ncbi:MAG: single-stranded DNA-binding protein [Campylobacter sp.]|nr:single-stranded DNA-binding protein [Campylobacter sp.]
MFNKVILLGNLTRDIEMRYSQNGAAVANAGIAVNRKYTVNGEKREDVCFVDITFFGRTAEIANQYLKKGSKILIEGRLQYDTWQDKNTGANRSKHSVVVENMQMLGSSNDNQNSNYNQGGGNYSGGNSNYSSNQDSSYKNYQNKNSTSQQGGYDRVKQDDALDSYSENIPDIDIDDMDELPF